MITPKQFHKPYIAREQADVYVLIDPSLESEESLRAVIIDWFDQIEVRPRKGMALTPAEDSMVVRFVDGLKEGKSV